MTHTDPHVPVQTTGEATPENYYKVQPYFTHWC